MVARRISSSRRALVTLSVLSTKPHVVTTCQVLEVGVGACGHGGAGSAQFEVECTFRLGLGWKSDEEWSGDGDDSVPR